MSVENVALLRLFLILGDEKLCELVSASTKEFFLLNIIYFSQYLSLKDQQKALEKFERAFSLKSDHLHAWQNKIKYKFKVFSRIVLFWFVLKFLILFKIYITSWVTDILSSSYVHTSLSSFQPSWPRPFNISWLLSKMTSPKKTKW